MSVKSVIISPQAISVEISNLVVQQGTVPSGTVEEVLALARISGVTAYNYTGDQLTTIDYANFKGITGHSKTLSYTGDQLTSLNEEFVYDAQTWTYDATLTYTGEQLASKAATLNIV